MWIRSISIYSDLLADTWRTKRWLQMKSKIDTIRLLSKSIKLTPDRGSFFSSVTGSSRILKLFVLVQDFWSQERQVCQLDSKSTKLARS